MLKQIIVVAVVAAVGACSDPPPPSEVDPAPATPAMTSAVPATSVALESEPGRDAYEHFCAACHDPGPGHPGTMRLALRADPAHAVLLERRDLSPAHVKQIARTGLGMMPPFRPTEIADAELEELVAYVTRKYSAN